MPRFQIGDTTRLLLNLYIPSMIMSFGHGMVVPTIPILAKSFDVSVGLAAQVVTAQLLGGTLALIPAGALMDRIGRRPVLLAGPILLALGAAVTAITPDFSVLLAAQFVSGVGNRMWGTAREIAAVDIVRPEQRGRMLSGFMGMSSVGLALGPVLGGIMTSLFDFRSVFWVYAAMALITLAVSARIPETAHRGQGSGSSPPLPGSATPQSSPPLRGSVREGGRLFGRLSEVEPYFRATYVVIIINTFVAMMRGSLINSILPLYVGVQLGFSAIEVGTLFSIYGLVNVLMIAPTGILSDSAGRKAIVVPSTYIATFVFIGFPLATGMVPLSVLVVFLGIATGLALGSMATYTYDVIPAHARGRLQALRRTIGESGAVAGPMVAGVVADALSPSAAFWFFVPLQLIAGLLITFMAKESLHRVRGARGS